MANPLLTVPVLPTLVRFALPNMAAMLATALAAIAETSYVGQLGVPALAGMALVFPMMMLQLMMSGGAMGGGVSSAVSRALGAGQPARADALAVHAFWIGVGAGAIYTVVMLLGGPALYALLGGRDEALAQAVAYSGIAFTGSIGVWLTNTLASIIRGSGDMKTPSVVFFAVSVAQVVLAAVLGLGLGPVPRLGMAGIAAGQVIAYALGAIVLLVHLHSARSPIRLALRKTRLQWSLARDILRVGALACVSPLQTVLTILVLTRLVSHFGTTALAGYGIGTRLEFLLIPIAFAIGVASVPLVGMAMGAGRFARAREAAWKAAGLSTVTLGLIGVALALFPTLWSGLFTSDPAVIEAAASYFRWAGPFYGLLGMGLCLYFSSLSAGKVGGPVLAGTLRLAVIAIGGWVLAQAQTPPWTIYALIGLGMAAYGLATALAVRFTPWGPPRT